jgi:peptide/nickel transport system substrate-binding protein
MAAGIEIQTNFPQAPQVTTAVENGDFDLACWGVSGVSAASPWQRFHDVLDDRGVPGLGKSAFFNYGRFHDSAVHSLLDSAAAATSDAQAKELYTELDTIFMKNLPMIPLMYRPLEFFEYNASTWTGFPSAKNPTAPPQFSGAGNAWLFGLKHVS